MDSVPTGGRAGDLYGTAADRVLEESFADQARRRAARWHAWLKSPECTFQDRENFERWCSDVTNAAAYVAFCGDLVGGDELVDTGDEVGYMNQVFTSPSQRLEAEQR